MNGSLRGKYGRGSGIFFSFASMSEITYHRATLNDVGALIDSRVEFLCEFWGEQPSELLKEFRAQLEEYFSSGIRSNVYISYIARHGSEIAGVGGMVIRHQPGSFRNPSGKVGYLMSMYTVPVFRKRGICTSILNALLNDAKKMGVIMFELHATKEGEPVYRKNGFAIHHEPTMRKYT
jgi:predicted acetyltransferase